MPRQRSSGAEDVIDLTARLPWWIGVLGALIAFIVLRITASMDVTPTANTKEIGGMVIRQFVKTVATFGQWLLPMLFLMGAAFSAFKQRKRRALYNDVAGTGARTLSDLSWQDFERLVMEYFQRRGFSAREGDRGADGGVDVWLKKGADRYLVQCKHWRAMSVGVEPVRELYGVMAAQRAAGAFLVTTGRITEEARRFASGREIELIDGAQLELQIQRAASINKPSPGTQATATPSAVKRACPTCGSAMLLRKAIKGSSAGQSFYGCSNFPRCRGTRPA